MRYLKFAALVPLIVIMLGGCSPANHSEITTREIEAHLRFLSDDLLEGRAVGSRGEALAALYQETQLRLAGVEPFFEGSFQQPFTLRGSTPDRQATLEVLSGRTKTTFPYKEAFVATSNREDCPEVVEAELVYGGYLIQAPERGWDDIKGADLRGKVLLCEINEPGNYEGGIFDGEDMTYYGRWTYKLEKAAELGAAGVLIIHNAKGAAYGWEVVQNSWAGEGFFLPDRPQTLFFQGWVRGETASSIFEAAGQDRQQLLARAEGKDFKPVPLGLKVRVRQKPFFRTVEVRNIVGQVFPLEKKYMDRAIILSAHYDHLGRDVQREGDQVYNGAVDNCSASASLLALGRYYARHPEELRVRLILAAVTAEEEGLLGSDYLARHLPLAKSSVLADLNLEMTNVWGEAEDVFAIGAKHSDLDDVCRRAAEFLGLRYIPEREGNLGYFFRSDQLSFARAGIPAVWLHEGIVSRGGKKDYIQRMTEDYKKNRYHKVTDAFEPGWDLRGTVQICRWAQEIIRQLGRQKSLPQFRPTSSFKR